MTFKAILGKLEILNLALLVAKEADFSSFIFFPLTIITL